MSGNSRYHQISEHKTYAHEETVDLRKSPVTKMVEECHHKGINLPDIVLKNIEFTKGFYTEFYVQFKDMGISREKIEETYAENLINNLPLEYYEKYMDITWLKTYKEEKRSFISSLLYREKFDVVNKFLDFVSQENKENDFNKEIFEPIFNLNSNLMNLSSKWKKNSEQAIKNYLKVFTKALEVYEPYYLDTCKKYRLKSNQIVDIKKWHKNFDRIYLLNGNNKLHGINLELLKYDTNIDFIKDIFSQYDNVKENLLLQEGYFCDAIKNGSEKIVTFYISEFLRNNLLTQERIENLIIKSFHEKVNEMEDYIKDCFKDDYKNDLKLDFKLDKIYDIAVKYANYKEDKEILSKLLLSGNKQNKSLFNKTIKINDFIYEKLNVKQWQALGEIVEQMMIYNEKGFQQSAKQRSNRNEKEFEKFLKENPYVEIYMINQINKTYGERKESISDKELEEVYKYVKKAIAIKLEDRSFDVEKFTLNNRLLRNLDEKLPEKKPKI